MFSSQINNTVNLANMLKTALKQWVFVLLIFALPAASAAQQESPSNLAVTEFVQTILSRSGSPSTISVTFQNLASLPAETQESLQNQMFTAFRNANIRLVKPEQASADVQITFSEDWQNYVWIASVHQGPSSQLVIKKLPHQQRTIAARAPTLTIKKTPVWEQDGPILDFFADSKNLLVLEPEQLSLYANDSGQWKLRQTLGIPHSAPWPRDLRGRMEAHGGEIDVYLPGMHCNGHISPPSLDCRASDDPWPIDAGQLTAFYSSRRNFFSGLLAGQSGGNSVVPFFSGATWQMNDQRLWIFTGTDGRTRLFQNELASQPVAMFSGWGSTLAAIHSSCGSGWQLLTSSPADTTRPDSVQAVEFNGHEALPASAPVDLLGTVEVLWTTGNNSQVVNGVLQSQSGRYESFTLTVACSQ